MKKTILFLLVGSFSFYSCSITKRRYLSGYHVEWNHHTKKEKPKKDTMPMVASISENSEESIIPTTKIDYFPDTTICDEITLTNGDLIKGKVEEIGLDAIKYRDCDNLSGALIDIAKSTVFVIRYANGKRIVITKPEDKTPDEDIPPPQDEAKIAEAEKKYLSPDYNPSAQSEKPTNGRGLGTAALVFGILALVSWYGSFLFGLLAIIFGGSALSKIHRSSDSTGSGSATAGLILGIISMVAWAIILFVL